MPIEDLINLANQLAYTLDIQLKGRLLKLLIFNSSKWRLPNKIKNLIVSASIAKSQDIRKKVTNLSTPGVQSPLASLSRAHLISKQGSKEIQALFPILHLNWLRLMTIQIGNEFLSVLTLELYTRCSNPLL